MKKLKYLLIPLISLLFIINVKADSVLNSVQYPVVESYLSNNSGKTFEDFRNLVMSKIEKPSDFDDYDNYLVYINYSSGNWFQVSFLLTDYISFGNRYNSLKGRYRYDGSTNKIYGSTTTCVLKFNDDYNDLSWVMANDLTTSCNFLDYYTTNFYDNNFLSSSTPSSRPDLWNMIISSNLNELNYSYSGWDTTTFIINGKTFPFNSVIPFNDISYYSLDEYDYYKQPTEPTYSYTSTILNNGNVKLDFTFTNYTSDSGYAFEIENNVSNEEYGIENTYSSIFPNQIPFGSSYSIELSYDSLLYVTLSKYEQVEQTSLYFREEIYTNMIDINNVVFENEQDPYFIIYRQTKNLIEGSFANTTSNNTCWYRYSTSQNEDFVPCDEILGLSFYDNGFVEVLIKKGSTTVYSRKINYLGSTSNEPYIIYNITKQDFYSVLNFSVENYVNGLTYRVSTDNGINFSNWQTYDNTKNNFINVFDNSTIIIEIANSNQDTIYDSKSIVVVNNINEIKSINNTTTNFLDKFRSIFNVNTNILRNINNFYDNIKLSKIYLLIFIPFLASLIGAIIYLIRRK